ncbi:MAG: hypothetical protein ACI4F4_09685 [Lachnospiraceae bacterium]
MDKIYYEDQDGWTSEDFYYLHRQLHRLFFYYKKYSEEIVKMDILKMSDETRTLIYCIIKYYNYDFLFSEYENLRELVNTEPLKETLVLDDDPLPEDNIYKRMNVRY